MLGNRRSEERGESQRGEKESRDAKRRESECCEEKLGWKWVRARRRWVNVEGKGGGKGKRKGSKRDETRRDETRNSRMINEIIVLSLSLGRSGEVNSVDLAHVFDSVVGSGESYGSRVEFWAKEERGGMSQVVFRTKEDPTCEERGGRWRRDRNG